jgi:hypothetical protein
LAWRRTIDQHRGNGRNDDFSDVAFDAAVHAAAEKYVRGGYKAVQRAADLFHEGSEPAALVELGGPKAKAFVDIALVGLTPLRAFLGPWYATRESEVEKSTAFMDRRAVSSFVEAHPLLTDVTKASVAKWIEGRRGDVTAATVID